MHFKTLWGLVITLFNFLWLFEENTRFQCVLSILSLERDAPALLSSPSFPSPLCQELWAHIPHALLAQPGKYGTVTATILPDWTGTLMRWLTALIQAASTALSEASSEVFYSFIGYLAVTAPLLCACVWVCPCVHVFMCMHVNWVPLCACVMWLCVGGEPAGHMPWKSDSEARFLLSLVAWELPCHWLACLHWQHGVYCTGMPLSSQHWYPSLLSHG